MFMSCCEATCDRYLVFFFFLPASSDIEDLCEPANVLPSNGLNDTTILLEQLKHAEHRARLAEAALARAQDDLQKMK